MRCDEGSDEGSEGTVGHVKVGKVRQGSRGKGKEGTGSVFPFGIKSDL